MVLQIKTRVWSLGGRLEKRRRKKAKKDYKNLLKKYGFKKELEDIDDYDAYYNKKEDDNNEADEDQNEMSEHFKNEREKNFYKNGEDMDFVKYHKRVTRNFHTTL